MHSYLVALGDFQYDLYVGGGTYTYEISWEIYEVRNSRCARTLVELHAF